MEIAPGGVQSNREHRGPTPSGPLRHPSECSVESLHKLAARSIRYGNRCIPDSMARSEGICLSSVCHDWPVSSKSTSGASLSGPSSSSACGQVNLGMRPCSSCWWSYQCFSPTGARPPNGSLQPVSSIGGSEPANASRMESVRQRHRAEGLSERSSKLIWAGWSKATNTTYQSAWRKWSGWCSEWQADPLSCGISVFFDFLADLYDRGLEHRSINTIRSAVSMTHVEVDRTPIGQHPLVSRLLRGVYNQRTPQPRYPGTWMGTWKVDRVLEHIVSLGDHEVLSLKGLSLKLAILMALVKASRSSEVQALDL